MSHMTFNTWKAGLWRLAAAAVLSLLPVVARAAVPGITGPTFDLTAQPGRANQPDGASVYSWGYGCNPRTVPASCPASTRWPGRTVRACSFPAPR